VDTQAGIKPSAGTRLPWGRLSAWITIAAAVALVALRLDVGLEPKDDGSSAVSALVTYDPSAARPRNAPDAATRFCALLLAEADRKLAGVDTIHAVFYKRERIDGQLQENNVMDLKVRRSPKSVYLRWQKPNEGREVTWREDAHDGQIVVRVGGWRRKLVPLLKVDPLSERAMQYSRRPVTSIGLWNFNARLRQFVEEDVARGSWRTQLREDTSLLERPCYCFTFLAAAGGVRPQHQRVVIYVDKVLGLPVACELYGWPTPKAPELAPLEESYAFSNLELNRPVSDRDFDLTAEAEASVARKP
jgi:Protein of unknown function (DUF1571)